MNDLPKIVRERMQAAVAGDHPNADLLTAFAEQALPERERRPLLEHLARCADCRDVLALAAVSIGSPASQTKDTGVARKAPWFSFPVLRWGALAACVVVVGTAVLMYRNEKIAYTTKDLRQLAVPSASARAESTPADSERANPVESKTKAVSNEEIATAAPSTRAAAPSTPAPLSRGARERALTPSVPAPNQAHESVFTQPVAKQPVTPPASGANAMLAKNLRDDRQMDSAHSAFVGGMTAGFASKAAAPAPAPTVSTPAKKDAPAPQPPAPVEISAARDNGPLTLMVDATSADADKSEKKVEVPGRAKISGASTNALAEAPSDELNMQKSITPAPSEMARVRKQRGAFSREEGLRWNLSSDGQLQRSADSGKSWQPVSVAESATFRALTFNGPDIWVGGAAGSLYHSSDAGGHWTQVKPVANNIPLSADIAGIAFTDPQHGKITTTNGQTWTTADGGQSWTQQP